MPIATFNGNGQVNGNGNGATRSFKWLAARDVTAEVGGEANVEQLRRTSYDFSSTFHLSQSRHLIKVHPQDGALT